MRGAVRLAVLERLSVAVHLTLQRQMKAPQQEQTPSTYLSYFTVLALNIGGRRFHFLRGLVDRFAGLTSLGLPPGLRARLRAKSGESARAVLSWLLWYWPSLVVLRRPLSCVTSGVIPLERTPEPPGNIHNRNSQPSEAEERTFKDTEAVRRLEKAKP